MEILALGLILANLTAIGLACSLRIQGKTIIRQRAEIERLTKALQEISQ